MVVHLRVRIDSLAQYGASGPEYYLGDALGSVRQMVDASGEVTLGRNYKPYGGVLSSTGSGATSYGFTNEWTDASTGDVYLRARWYAVGQGRFLTKDTWQGDYQNPLTLNRWNYVTGNPIKFVDPTGFIVNEKEYKQAEIILSFLEKHYSITVKRDWGYQFFGCLWKDGNWSILELNKLKEAVVDMSGPDAFGSEQKFVQALGKIQVDQRDISTPGQTIGQNITLWDKSWGTTNAPIGKIDIDIGKIDVNIKWVIVHEFSHLWDSRKNWQLSDDLESKTHGYTNPSQPNNCNQGNWLPGCNKAGYYYGGIPAKGSDINFDRKEDFAESVAAYLYTPLAANFVSKNYFKPPYYQYLYYSDYRSMDRWQIVFDFFHQFPPKPK
jgi:RHS repeat-associated protein